MGLFDFLKKKDEPNYDPTRVGIKDLAKGFVFEYDLKNWVVEEEYEYDWGNNFYSKEFKVDNGEEKLYLSVEDDDEMEIILSKKIKIAMIEPDVHESLRKGEKAPKKIIYKDKKFYFDAQSEGWFRVMSEKSRDEADWDRLLSWDYYDEDDEEVISIEQWGDDEFEASLGQNLKEYQISNITPGN